MNAQLELLTENKIKQKLLLSWAKPNVPACSKLRPK